MDEIGDGAHGLDQRGRVVLLVQVVKVDVVGAEPSQAVLAGLNHPLAREAPAVRPLAGDAGALGGEHPPAAVVADGPPDHLLRGAAVIGVGGVDEVDPGLAGAGDDPVRVGLFRLAAEHHGAETERRDLDAASSKRAVLHDRPPAFADPSARKYRRSRRPWPASPDRQCRCWTRQAVPTRLTRNNSPPGLEVDPCHCR